MNNRALGFNELLMAILAIIILIIITLVLIGVIKPSSESAISFGKQAKEVFK